MNWAKFRFTFHLLITLILSVYFNDSKTLKGQRRFAVTVCSLNCSFDLAERPITFYRPQTKFGARWYFQKRVSRILSTGGGGVLPQCMLGYHTPIGSRHPLGPDPPKTRHPPSKACWEIRSTSGRYASYWNAILFVRDIGCFIIFILRALGP